MRRCPCPQKRPRALALHISWVTCSLRALYSIPSWTPLWLQRQEESWSSVSQNLMPNTCLGTGWGLNRLYLHKSTGRPSALNKPQVPHPAGERPPHAHPRKPLITSHLPHLLCEEGVKAERAPQDTRKDGTQGEGAGETSASNWGPNPARGH